MSKSDPLSDVFRVRLRYQDVDTFVQKYAPNVSRGGLFLASRHPRAVGDVFRFDVTLGDGSTVLSGEGRVTWVKQFDPEAPTKPHGMGVQFVKVDRGSRPILDRILAFKAGKPPAADPPTQPTVAEFADQTHRTMAGPGSGAAPKNGEPAPEAPPDLSIDDAAVRRAVDRARTLGVRYDDLEALAAPEAPEEVSKEQALAELPRLLDRGDRRRKTGAFKIPPE